MDEPRASLMVSNTSNCCIFDISGAEVVFADLEWTPVRTITDRTSTTDFTEALRDALPQRPSRP